MASENTARLAVLIDADNAQPSITEGLLAEVAKYGTAHVKRAYGDWTSSNLKGWKDQLLAQSIHPIQQFAYTRGKNATDSAMVIDAMDLLYSGRFDGFCIVSSDSDFTRLAQRLRESGLTVYGFGERKTPKPFVAACDKFIYVENLQFDDEESGAAAGAAGAPPMRRVPATAAQLKADTALVALLRGAVEAASDDDGWAPLAAIGNIIGNQRPDFDSRSYGYAKLSDLVAAITLFEIDRHSPGGDKQAVVYARVKRRAPATKVAAGRVAAGKVAVSKATVAEPATGETTGGEAANGRKAPVAKGSTRRTAIGKTPVGKTSVGKTSVGKTTVGRATAKKTEATG